MRGAIATVAVAERDLVNISQMLMVLEAMKMEHAIVVLRDGKVATINVAPGRRVDNGTETLAAEMTALIRPLSHAHCCETAITLARWFELTEPY